MSQEKIKERIKYLEGELAHEGYLDGWVIKGHKKELKELKLKLKQKNNFLDNLGSLWIH
jgi:hypothetical protein